VSVNADELADLRDRRLDDATRRADRERVSAVLVVDDNPRCDREAAQLLIRFARSEIQALSRRRTLGQVKDTLLWCAFAWNYAVRETAEEALALLEKDHGRDAREQVEELFRRRLGEYAAIDRAIGPLRVTRLRSGAVAVHVDAEPLPNLPDIS
jgi:hypothetical protein